MSSFGYFRLKPRPGHTRAVLKALKQQDAIAPQELAKQSGLTLTQVKCVLNDLELRAKIKILRGDSTPRLRVTLVKRLNSPPDLKPCESV
jgi:DNA-binding MarR family transcriptional regulator